MNIQRKEIDIELNGNQYIAVVDFGAAVEFEGLTGKSIINEMNNIAQTQSLHTLACIMASVIKKEKNKSIGLNEVLKVDLIEGMSYFIDKMGELLENSLPKDENYDEDNKKKIVEKMD